MYYFYYHFARHSEDDVMNIRDTTYTIMTVTICTLVAFFLLNTGRGLKAIQLCKECLIFLNNKELKKEEKFVKLLKIGLVYRAMFAGYSLIPDYTNAAKYGRKLLVIYREFGKLGQEGNLTMKLAEINFHQCKYAEAKKLYERAINIMRETGNRKVEGAAYGNFGIMSYHLGDYVNAKKYFEKALEISMEIGDKEGEATIYGNLGAMLTSLSEFESARSYLEKALLIKREIGHKAREALSYGNLGAMFESLGEYVQAKEYLENELAICMEIGYKAGEAIAYGNLGVVLTSLRELPKAKEYLEKALAIRMEIGDRDGEAADYGNLGNVFASLGNYEKAKECLMKAFAISKEIGDRAAQVSSYGSLGALFYDLGEHVMAEGYLKKALSIGKGIILRPDQEFTLCCNMTMVKYSQGKFREMIYFLLRSIINSENLRGFLEDNDQFKISFTDIRYYPYRHLSAFFCLFKNPNNALYVLELGRARALADLMAAKYSVERQISANPRSWIGIENIIKKESKCTCLYISYYGQYVFLWILTMSGDIHLRRKTVNESIDHAALVHDLDDFFAKSFRSFGILPNENCEDRPLNMEEPNWKSNKEESLADLRLVEDNDEDNRDPEPSLPLCYKMLIAPVADLLDEPEIIVAPDRALYQVPFAALSDKDGKYLSESFRIRIVPSLTTLKLIQDSPADYHSQTGALIVGDPVVGRVLYKGRTKNITQLPCARKEAEMIGQLLGVRPLLGEHATKQAVLQMIHSVSLIHFAAHGNAERGEIALSPGRSSNRIPLEEEYLLTMSDISQVQLRAKLVVLSCCHSGSGQIRAEGVVGIARAFLGSGARSVLVALWALGDRATEQLMRRFYEHLVRGDSASESLHEAMKWMRCNGYPKVCDWAPFVLIGDNVTFDFGKVKVSLT